MRNFVGSTFIQGSPLPLTNWTTASRPTGVTAGDMGFNTDLGQTEVWSGSMWIPQGSTGLPGTNTGWTSVKAAPFNAVGNGTTDDTVAIQMAANAVPATGGVLFFPPAVYGVTGTISIQSNTIVLGYGATLLALVGANVGNFITNQGNAARVITDHDIGVHGMTFDYGSSSATGTSHAVGFLFASNIRVTDCTFQCRGIAGNATAMTGCYNTSVENCSAFGFINCAYDHWWGPQQARVIDCYAETSLSSQIALFNPEPTSGPSTGLAAVGFTMTGCEFKYTNVSQSVPMQFEPLGAGTTVSDVEIHNNVFINCRLVMRGAVNNIDVSHNTFDTVLGGGEAITSYSFNGGSPTNLTVIGNKVLNPSTLFSNEGVIRIETSSAIIFGNTVTGSGYTAYSISTSTLSPFVLGNSVSGPTNIVDSYIFSGNLALTNGVSFGSQTASGPTDFTKHIELWGTASGISITSATVNYVTFTGGAHTFYQGPTEIGYLNAGGMNLVAGLGYAINGTVVLSGFVGGWGTPTGGNRIASFPGATATLLQTSEALAQLILDLQAIKLLQT